MFRFFARPSNNCHPEQIIDKSADRPLQKIFHLHGRYTENSEWVYSKDFFSLDPGQRHLQKPQKGIRKSLQNNQWKTVKVDSINTLIIALDPTPEG